MLTHYLGQEEVDAYLRDLGRRLLSAAELRPTLLCPVGPSGLTLVRTLCAVCPQIAKTTRSLPVGYNRNAKQVSLQSDDPGGDIKDQHVLVLDSSIHSGSTMNRGVRKVQEFCPAAITSYALVVKRTSVFVPTFWGVMIDDHDRAYFLLEELPNNRLNPDRPAGHLRLLCQDDLTCSPIICGVDSMDKISWADRWYDMRSSERERSTYLLEHKGEVVGYVTFALRMSATGVRSLIVDEVAVAQTHQNQGHSSSLMRWAETLARQMDCSEMTLWAIEDQVPKYEHWGYELNPQSDAMDLDGDVYKLMSKKIIYHIWPDVF